MAITDPKNDTDVSKKVADEGFFEPILTMVWHDILRACHKPDGSKRLVLDVGANFGYYSLMAASLGCRVMAWEPVPNFAAFAQYGLLLNGLTELVELRDKIVSTKDGQTLQMSIPTNGIWGTAGVGGSNIDPHSKGFTQLEKATERIDSVVDEDVLLIKARKRGGRGSGHAGVTADVEGFEPQVFQSAKRLFQHWDVENVIMEYSPGIADHAADWKRGLENPEMLLRFLNAGYRLFDVPWDLEHSFPGYGHPIPELRAVTAEMLVHDVQDMRLAVNGHLGCRVHPELDGLLGFKAKCNSVPETVHPHSYHSTIWYNTNVWAAKRATVNTAGSASLVDPGVPLVHGYLSPDARSPAGRPCRDVPIDMCLAARCPCPVGAGCEAAQAKLAALAKQGSLNTTGSVGDVDVRAFSLEAW